MLLLGIFNQLEQDLGIRIATEGKALLFQLVTQRRSVFDDAVVHHGQLSALRQMGMGIRLVRHPVRRPARVGDTDGARAVMARGHLLQVGDLANRFVDIQIACLVDHGHARRVISAVLQPMQTFYQDRIRLPAPKISYDSTHKVPFCLNLSKVMLFPRN